MELENLKRLKTRIRYDLFEDGILNESVVDYLKLIKSVISEKSKSINEDGDGGGTGVAMANAGTVSGMGNVVSSQPSSVPGAAFTGDGTVGSGDIGMPLGVYTKKGVTGDKYVKLSKGKKSKLVNDISDFLKKNKKGKSPKYGNTPDGDGGKLMKYEDFMKSQTSKVTKVSE